MKKVAILQSNYIPWKGYFDIIASVDECIIFDDVQYTKRDWRNRNQIRTENGPQWLTVPVLTKGLGQQLIQDTLIDGHAWVSKHKKAMQRSYARAPYYEEISEVVNPVYDRGHEFLSELNVDLLIALADYLNISTKFSFSRDYEYVSGKNERLVALCHQVNATEYISGPAAKSYIDEGYFNKHGLSLTWFDYYGYPQYKQLHEGFVHNVTIMDLLFNCGKNAVNYMKNCHL